MINNNFLGKNGFIWFNGVVEDEQGPQKLGRLRVRCVGIHTQIKHNYSQTYGRKVIRFNYSSGISGLEKFSSFIVEGSWVFGYFEWYNQWL